MRKLTLTDILEASSKSFKEVELEVPALGGSLTIREMSAEAKDQYEQSLLEIKESGKVERNLSNARAKLVAACCYGPDGKRLFRTEEHIIALGTMPASIIEPIFEKCQEMNIISARDIEELAGN